MLPYYIHFIEQVTGPSELVHDEQYISDVHADASLELRLEHHIAAHRFPVAVKSQPDQFPVFFQSSLSFAGTTNSQLSGSSFSITPSRVV